MIIGTQRQERSCHVIASFWAELSRATPSYKKLESKCYGLQRGENMFQYVAAEIAHLYNIILFWCIRYLFKIFQACFMSTSRRMRIGSEEEYSQYSWFAPIIIGYIEPHINPVIAGWICPPSGEVVPPRTSCSLSFTKRWCYFSSIGFQDSKVPSKRAPPQFTSRFWGCECQSWCFHILLCTTVLFPIIFETFRRKSAPTKTSEQFHWKNCGRFFFCTWSTAMSTKVCSEACLQRPWEVVWWRVIGIRELDSPFQSDAGHIFLGPREISRQWLFNYWATIWTLS